MPNEIDGSSFPASRQDVSNLKKTAIDAARDLSSTASVHAEKAKGQIKELAVHAQKEGGAQLDEMKGKLADVANSAREYVKARPLACVGIALAVGFVIGLTRRGRSRD
jgi:ElaB/YqjD/DUF883 family membrane-anchored ribosome-binding protein